MPDVHTFVEKAVIAALAEGEQRFRALADESPFPVWVVDASGDVLLVNCACVEFCGVGEGELRGGGWRDRLHPEDAEHFTGRLLSALREQREFACEVRVRHSSGEWRWVEAHATPRYSPEGAFLGMVGCSSEITGEAALTATETKYRSLFENMAEEVHFWRVVRDEAGEIATWRLVDANPPTLRSWGKESVEEVRGKTTDEIFGPGAAEHYLPVVRKIFSEGAAHTYEDYFPHLDKHFRFTSVPFGESFITTGADITEIRKADEALRLSEERFRSLFEGHMAAMLLIELESGRILDANAAAAEFYGYSREQLQTMHIEQINLLSPDEVAAERRKAADRTTNVFVFPHRLAGGEVRYVEVYSSPVTIEGRQTLFSVIHDVTARRQAEEALERTRFTLAEAQRIAHLGSFEYDALSRKTVWSEEEYRIFGLDPAGPSPTFDAMLVECIHPDDADRLHEAFAQAVRSGSVYEHEHRIVWPDGSVRWVYERARPYVDEDQNLLRYVGATLDITEHKEAEKAVRESEEVFRAMFDQSQVGKVQVDPDSGRFLRVNEAFCRFTGHTEQELLARTFFEITHPDDRAEDFAKLAALRDGLIESFESEKRYLRPDQSVVWALVSVSLVRDEAGDARFTMGIVQDITARKEAEEALRLSEAERAAHLERARLARDLHDSVSQAIFAAALKAEALEIAAECVDDRIGPAASQVCRLCKGALADLRAMLLELRGEKLEDVPIDQLLRQLVEAAEGRTSARIGLSVHGSSWLPPDVHVAFYRVAQEALNNVARHARADNAWVEVKLGEAEGSLEVWDDGRGFVLRDFGVEHLGIRAMRERAAEVGADLELTSAGGEGTSVALHWRRTTTG